MTSTSWFSKKTHKDVQTLKIPATLQKGTASSYFVGFQKFDITWKVFVKKNDFVFKVKTCGYAKIYNPKSGGGGVA